MLLSPLLCVVSSLASATQSCPLSPQPHSRVISRLSHTVVSSLASATQSCLLSPQPHSRVLSHLSHTAVSSLASATQPCPLSPQPHSRVLSHLSHTVMSSLASATQPCPLSPQPHSRVIFPLSHTVVSSFPSATQPCLLLPQPHRRVLTQHCHPMLHWSSTHKAKPCPLSTYWTISSGDIFAYHALHAKTFPRKYLICTWKWLFRKIYYLQHFSRLRYIQNASRVAHIRITRLSYIYSCKPSQPFTVLAHLPSVPDFLIISYCLAPSGTA